MNTDSRIVELYVTYEGILDTERVHSLVYTNAPDEVIAKICEDIKNDGLLTRGNAINGMVNILQCRGFRCDVVTDLPSFGFTE